MTHVFIGSRDSFAVAANEAIGPSSFALALNRQQLIDKAARWQKRIPQRRRVLTRYPKVR
jgi:hypothetical protein